MEAKIRSSPRTHIKNIFVKVDIPGVDFSQFKVVEKDGRLVVKASFLFYLCGYLHVCELEALAKELKKLNKRSHQQ